MKNSIFILLLVTLIASCKKEAAVWETDWGAPVINDTLTLANLVNDSTLSENSGFYDLSLTRTLFDMDINEVVSIPDTTIHKDYTNGSAANLLVNPGVSFFDNVPGGPPIEEFDLALDDIQLKKITLKKGVIQVVISNPFATKAFFTVVMDGFSKDGISFNHTYEAPAGSVANPGVINQVIDLGGYDIDLTGESGTGYNKMTASFDVISDPNGPAINFGDEHTVPVSISFKEIEVNYARGYFGSRILSDTIDVDLEALNIYQSGAIDLSALSLSFEIENGIKLGAQGILHTVSNENALGSVVSLTGGSIGNAFNIDPATGNWSTLVPSINTIDFTSANSNIEAYLENLGTKHTVGYSMQLNPWGNTSGGWDELFPNSNLSVKLHANMPLAIGIDNLVLKDTFEVDLKQDTEKTHVVSGELILKTSNAFPFSADVSILMLDADGNVLHTIAGSELIEASQFGTFDSEHGFNVANSDVRFILSDEALADLDKITHLGVRAKLNSIDPNTNLSEQMIIPIDAFLSVKLKTKFKTENRF